MTTAPTTTRALLRRIADTSVLLAEPSGARTKIVCPQDRTLIGVVPARIKSPHTLNNIWSQVRRHLQEHPEDAITDNHSDHRPVHARPDRRLPDQPETPPPSTSPTRAPYSRGDLLGYRLAATVGSLGNSRRDRVARWRKYRDAYRERFGEYPNLERGAGRNTRPIFGVCPSCGMPEDSFCLPDCAISDRLDTR